MLDNSGDLYDTLGYINEWLATATEKVQALGDERVDSQAEANMVTVREIAMPKVNTRFMCRGVGRVPYLRCRCILCMYVKSHYHR